jgi:tRNA G18 (ribose-2'-O)-methylase SpoU
VIDGIFSVDPGRLSVLARDLAPDVASALERLVQKVSADVFNALAPHVPATGVLALARRPEINLERTLSPARKAPVILLEAPAHLGNIGAAIRVAAAAGAAGVITTGRHDPWDPAALRGSAGLHFAQPIIRVSELPAVDRPLLAIDPEGDEIEPATLPANALLAFGSERRGLSAALLSRAERRLAIPMAAKVSSLNLATAVAVTLYAWRLARKDASSGID